jgi:hypothetical protein
MSAAAINQAAAKATALEVWTERVEARALLVANSQMDLIEAVDVLWAAAERAGLVKRFGADEVQRILAESFARWSV